MGDFTPELLLEWDNDVLTNGLRPDGPQPDRNGLRTNGLRTFSIKTKRPDIRAPRPDIKAPTQIKGKRPDIREQSLISSMTKNSLINFVVVRFIKMQIKIQHKRGGHQDPI